MPDELFAELLIPVAERKQRLDIGSVTQLEVALQWLLIILDRLQLSRRASEV